MDVTERWTLKCYVTAVNQRRSGGGDKLADEENMRVFVTSYRERAVVSPVYNEAVHVKGDR